MHKRAAHLGQRTDGCARRPESALEGQQRHEPLLELQRTIGNRATSALVDSVQPIPLSARRELEEQFDADFSRVRLHTGADVERRTRDAGAQALTIGNDVFFSQPEIDTQLLRHELAHVIQQRPSPATTASKRTHEDEAEAAASGQYDAVTPGTAPAGSVQKAEFARPDEKDYIRRRVRDDPESWANVYSNPKFQELLDEQPEMRKSLWRLDEFREWVQRGRAPKPYRPEVEKQAPPPPGYKLEKTPEQDYIEGVERYGTLQRRAKARTPVAPNLFYGPHEQAVDDAAAVLDILPGARLGRLGMELAGGEKASGYPVDRVEKAEEFIIEGALTGLDLLGGEGEVIRGARTGKHVLGTAADVVGAETRALRQAGRIAAPAEGLVRAELPDVARLGKETLTDLPSTSTLPEVQPKAIVAQPGSEHLAPKVDAPSQGKTSAGPEPSAVDLPSTAKAQTPLAPHVMPPAEKAWHAPELTPEEVLDAYKQAGVQDPLSAKKVRSKAEEGYRFDPDKRRWTKPNKPVKSPGVEQEAGRVQEKVFEQITGWPKNTVKHKTRFGRHIPDYMVKRDPVKGEWVTAKSPSDAQVIADSKYYDATVVHLDDQIKSFVEMARRTNVPGQRMLLLMTNENAKIADGVIKHGAKRGVVVRQIKQGLSR